MMPRRYSRPWLIHLLADDEALTHRAVLGDHHARAGDFYENYARFSTDDLREMAAQILARSPGRPKRGYSIYQALVAEVEKLRARRNDLSERAACSHIANKYRRSADMLRKVYRQRLNSRPN
jgi:hypothetical protein